MPLPFPQINPETLAQAIKTYVAARQNVSALGNGGSANYSEVVRGWAEAITSVTNPSLAQFEANDKFLFNQNQNQNPQNVGVVTYLFNLIGSAEVGEWVYQVSSDNVSVSESATAAYGPAIGVVTEKPSGSTVRVQTVGNFLYANLPLNFLPLIPDSIYYIGPAGSIVPVPTPSAGGYVQEIGFSKSTHELVLNIQARILV